MMRVVSSPSVNLCGVLNMLHTTGKMILKMFHVILVVSVPYCLLGMGKRPECCVFLGVFPKTS